MEEMMILARLTGVDLPDRSNFYGYCNEHDYEPCTMIFFYMMKAINNGTADLKELMVTIKEATKNMNYKQFTELVLIINLLSWDMHAKSEKEGATPKYQEISEYLSDEYYKFRDLFYKKFKTEEARDYFFEMTD